MDSRTKMPRSMPSWLSRTSWYGPAQSAVMYVLIFADGAKCTTLLPATSPGSSRSISALETTFQCAGTVARQVNTDLRSGWSKQAKTRCASAVSNWL